MDNRNKEILYSNLVSIISETNGISLLATLDMMLNCHRLKGNATVLPSIQRFKNLIHEYHQGVAEVSELLNHPFSGAIYRFLKNFPLPFKEEHIHLTGSLSAEFIMPYLKGLLNGENAELYKKKINAVYGDNGADIKNIEDLRERLILKDDERFERYLDILLIPKLILTSREIHKKAAFSMSKQLFEKYNVGSVRLKFTYSRASSVKAEQIPGIADLSSEEVVLGLYDGFMAYKKQNPKFNFVLSPCFRKEESFYDSEKFSSKKEHFESQVSSILNLLDKHPELKPYLNDVDTVGNEIELYKKGHFEVMRVGFRRLASAGIRIRSHHGETFKTLKKGVQAVDNSMNIWRVDTLEHGLALGINPNIYFHSMMEEALVLNTEGIGIATGALHRELMEWEFKDEKIRRKLVDGELLSVAEKKEFVKTKYFHALEVEHYQHDVLNKLIDKKVKLTALPSSNQKLTAVVPGYKDHPFSWWEKKGIRLGVGTDNYVTLDTDYIKELLHLLFSEPEDLKIMKLLMVATGENRRPYISNLLWEGRKKILNE
jgi:adenosine deaminase